MVKTSLTEVAHFAALASTETELSELFEMCKVSEWANELALSCKIAVRRDWFNPVVKQTLCGTNANKRASPRRMGNPRNDEILPRRLKFTIVGYR